MSKNRGIRGLGRRSLALRSDDPREHRLPQALGSQIPYDPTLRVNRKGELGVSPLRAIADLDDSASTSDVIAKVNEILAEMRRSGAMEGRR